MRNILLIGPLPNPIDGCSYANKILCENLSKKNIDYKVINTNSKIISSKQGNKFSLKKAFIFLKVYFEMYKIFLKKVIYITPGQTFYGLLKYSPFILTCWLLRKPYVIHVHGNHLGKEYEQLRGFKKIIFHFLVSKASAGIVLSKSLIKNFNGLLDLEKVFVVENFAGNDLFSNASGLIKKESDIPRIIYLSNLMEEKGILDLLDALLILDNKIDYHAIIAGSIEDNIKSIVAEKLNLLKGKVDYVGIIQGADKINYLMQSNIFALPTYYKMEGQPISILEGLASGNIIITTNHAGIPDIISEENGYIVNLSSPESIAEVILRINKDIKNKVDNFSKINFNYALENFTEDKFSSKVIMVLRNVSKKY